MQGDLISRRELLKLLPLDMENPLWHFTGIRAAIEAAPAVDAVPVVRCKDCAHWKPCEVKGFEGKKYCEWAGWLVGENTYCVYGEVKSNAAY